MKTTEFKVHTIYEKEDIKKMEKVSSRKLRTITLAMCIAVLVLYAAVVMWEISKGAEPASLIPFVSGGILNEFFLIALIACIVVMIMWPGIRAKKILKDVPGGVLKANYYFYEKTFQYGWGNAFATAAYVEITELREMPEAFYLKTGDSTYWVKKSDFEVGTPEAFLEFMKGKVKCKVM